MCVPMQCILILATLYTLMLVLTGFINYAKLCCTILIFLYCGSLKHLCVFKLVSEKSKFVSFMEMIKMRRYQASHSILVQVQSAQSYKELSTYCESIGQVKNMFHYCEGAEPMVNTTPLKQKLRKSKLLLF